MKRIRVEIPGIEKLARRTPPTSSVHIGPHAAGDPRKSPQSSRATAGYRASPEVAKALQPTRAHSRTTNRWWPWLLSAAFLGFIAVGAKFGGRPVSDAIDQGSSTVSTPSIQPARDGSPLLNEPTAKTPEVVRAAPAAPPSAVKCDVEDRAGLRQQVITYEANGVVYAVNGQARARAGSRGWVDGKDKFEPQELLRLLDQGLKRCGSSLNTVPVIAAASVTPPADSAPRPQTMSADAFTKAANDGDGKTIESYLKAGFDVNARNSGILELGINGGTAVEAAAASGQCEILKRLLAVGGKADPKEVKFGFTPLSLAAQKGRAQCVKLLLDRGVRVDVRTEPGGDTALIMAAYQGHMEVVRLLVEAGASLSLTNKDGDTAYRAAHVFGNHAVAAYVKSKGAR